MTVLEMASGVTSGMASVLADGPETGKGSPVGLFVVLALCFVVYFLYRSMTKHLRRVPGSFDEPTAPDAPATKDDATDDDQTS